MNQEFGLYIPELKKDFIFLLYGDESQSYLGINTKINIDVDLSLFSGLSQKHISDLGALTNLLEIYYSNKTHHSDIFKVNKT